MISRPLRFLRGVMPLVRTNVMFDADGRAGLGGAVLRATVQHVALSSADIQNFEVS